MNPFERIIYLLQAKMTRPTSYGYFHLLCLGISIILIIYFWKRRNKYNEKQLNKVLLIYGFTALVLEVLKQVIWSFNYDPITNIVSWDYQWYAAPFQLCTTPIFASIIAGLTRNKKLKNSLLAYMMFFTILGSITTAIYPENCFTSDILINVHTMFLHCGSLVVSIYLLFNKKDLINKNGLSDAFLTFLVFVLIALLLNVSFYKLGFIGDETFNMFYISPYFKSSLPVYDIIQEKLPYYLYLLVYIFSIFAGAFIVFFVSKTILNSNSR